MKIAEYTDGVSRASVDASAPAQSSRRSRPLLLLERTMYREGRTPFTSVFTIKLLGRLDEGRLRQALARVQAKHPLLRCVIERTPAVPASFCRTGLRRFHCASLNAAARTTGRPRRAVSG